MRIIIIGFMGSGKSTVAKALAHDLGFKFIDIDSLIEVAESKTITQIFEINGEEYFRKLECEKLIELASKKFIVVAAGGGTPCSENNIATIKNNFISIFLNIEKDKLLARLNKNDTKRPLIKNTVDLEKTVDDLMEKRLKYYHQADIILDVNRFTTKEIVLKIMAKL